jgi:hypothetical protein
MPAPYSPEFRRAIFLVSILLFSSVIFAPMTSLASFSKSTTVWNGTINLVDGYTVESGEILIVEAGTEINLGDDKDILIAGRITIQGSSSSPVILNSIIGNHDGLIFNSSSNGLGSIIDNLTIRNSEYGITIYGSNPTINNLTVENADLVAIDLFDSASPRINDLIIEGGGQDIPLNTNWRKGIGLSVGASSSPIVNGALINDLVTRGLNYWGNSGGIISNLHVSNISGATTTIAAGIWVEDSLPLIIDSSVKRSDNGIYVRHITQGWNTRPTFTNVIVEDSQYRGVMVEQYNHSQFSNLPMNAVFTNLIIRGTGGIDAKTPGLGIAALDVNTSGIKIEGALIENNPVVGFRAYMIDSSMIVNNLTLLGNGENGLSVPFNDRAGLFWRSSNWGTSGPPTLNNLVVRNSSGPGILLWKGGVRGTNWETSENGASGVDFREFHPDVNAIQSMNNTGHGVSVRDSSNVELEYIVTSGNGVGSLSANLGSGFYFDESNDVVSGGKNVSCYVCTSIDDNYGITVEDSIDLQLDTLTIINSINLPAFSADNSGLSQNGNIIINDILIYSNSTDSNSYAIELNDVDAEISNLEIQVDNKGLYWDAKGSLVSYLNDSIIDSQNIDSCLDLVDHSEFLINNIGLRCNSSPSIDSSFVNITNSFFYSNSSSNNFLMKSSSHLRWISSSVMDTPSFQSDDNIVDEMWFVETHVLNQYLNHIPFSSVNLSFDNYESEYFQILPYEGIDILGPFIGERWTPINGWSEVNNVHTGCDYDLVHNDSESFELNSDKVVNCILEISNQPPIIMWLLPESDGVYASGSEVIFDASSSWDLDNELMTYSWSSNIDGDITSSCQFNDNNSIIIANGIFQCLSDGIHQITLEVCDSSFNCAIEVRTIELTNTPPLLTVDTTPDISAWGTLYLGKTASVNIDLTGTSDPENDELSCWIRVSYEQNDTFIQDCPGQINKTFPFAPNQFSVTVFATDGINSPVTWTFNVELFNELPIASFEIITTGTKSQDILSLDGTNTFDPEGDEIKFEFWSDIDGLIDSGVTPDTPIEWSGTLSKGTHLITMYASDDIPNHAGRWTSSEKTLVIENSPPVALISSPNDGYSTDSGFLIPFDASGSGDWDIACLDLENSTGIICNHFSESSKDLVSVLWQSNLISEPIGSEWKFEARLPAGEHEISLIIDDGDGGNAVFSTSITVDEAAPVLVLTSPEESIDVYSNLPVLFDFRDSFDPDGDDFTVSIFSDLIESPILENKTNDYWYNDYMPAGNHVLSFVLTDSTGKSSIYYQELNVFETSPVAGIRDFSDGQYIPPGREIILNASPSFDYDNDIILYEWSLGDGTSIGNKEQVSVYFPPGPVRINLIVTDSRGASDSISINLTIGASSPVLSELIITPNSLVFDEVNAIFVTVKLEDLDGTTQMLFCKFKAGVIDREFQLRDDGTEGDLIAGDNIWTLETALLIDDGGTAKVEVWAIDGEIVSPVLIELLPIESDDERNLISWLFSGGLPLLLVLITISVIIGILYSVQRRKELAKDLEMIESWSTFDPRELDNEFNE